MDIYDIILIIIVFTLLYILMNNYNCNEHFDMIYMDNIQTLKNRYKLSDIKPFNY